MYRCSFCRRTSPPRVPKKSWPVLRPNGSVAAERDTCPECHAMLISGMPVSLVERLRRLPEPPKVPEPVPPPPPPISVQTTAASAPEPVAVEVVQGVEILGVKVDLPTRMIAPNPKKDRRPKTKKQRKEDAKR